MNLSALKQRLFRGTEMEGVEDLDSLPEELQDELWKLAGDLALVERDVAHLPERDRILLRQRFIDRAGIDLHPFARTIYWMVNHLRKEPPEVLRAIR